LPLSIVIWTLPALLSALWLDEFGLVVGGVMTAFAAVAAVCAVCFVSLYLRVCVRETDEALIFIERCRRVEIPWQDISRLSRGEDADWISEIFHIRTPMAVPQLHHLEVELRDGTTRRVPQICGLRRPVEMLVAHVNGRIRAERRAADGLSAVPPTHAATRRQRSRR